ncbi:hypothetical protein MG296_12700 [Flavobacteriaceae bacterium TK19130]|nr:hypothetical protein [Thermobacterium salinum]
MKIQSLLLATLLFISCSSDDDGDTNQDEENQFADIVQTLPQDTWQVTYFFDDGEDKTENFLGFEFDFDAEGNVIATTDVFSETGTWSYEGSSNDSNDDDGVDDDEELILQFSQENPFDELTDDWHIQMANDNTIELFDEDEDGNDETDFLTFTKI